QYYFFYTDILKSTKSEKYYFVSHLSIENNIIMKRIQCFLLHLLGILLSAFIATATKSPDLSKAGVGCFSHTRWNQAIEARMCTKVTDITPEKCYYCCIKASRRLFGLHNGVDCYCGNAVLTVTQRLSDRRCRKMQCKMLKSATCGGRYSMEVFAVGLVLNDDRFKREAWLKQTPKVANSVYLGCYHYSYNFPLSKTVQHSTVKMTGKLCYDYCVKQGFKYFGLTKSRFCYCDKRMVNCMACDQCRVACEGNIEETCGGKTCMDVFEIL
ncbi:hypothetical protein BOX15_Mlig015978g2, partial [Macrostomum lignano]